MNSVATRRFRDEVGCQTGIMTGSIRGYSNAIGQAEWSGAMGADPVKPVSKFRLVVVTAGTLLAWTEAFAYIDPGTGSLILQWLVGMVLAGLAVLNVYWQRIKSFFSGKSRNDTSGTEAQAIADEAEPD